MVFDKGDVEAVLAAELDVGALEQVQGGSVKATLCRSKVSTQWWMEELSVC